MADRYPTVQHRRTGRVHLTETLDLEGDGSVTVTLCGHWVRRDRYRPAGHTTGEADCETCWTAVAARTPLRRRTAVAA